LAGGDFAGADFVVFGAGCAPCTGVVPFGGAASFAAVAFCGGGVFSPPPEHPCIGAVPIRTVASAAMARVLEFIIEPRMR
jgi:hypothetical protein